MYLSVLVPSAHRSEFARFVDTSLSAIQDWRLVLYQEDSSPMVSSVHEGFDEIDQIRSLIFVTSACANPKLLPEIMLQHSFSDICGSGMDLWSFNLNPYQLLDDIEEVLEMFGVLGCYWALHSFRIGNLDHLVRISLL